MGLEEMWADEMHHHQYGSITPKEVDELLEDLYSRIMDEVEERLSAKSQAKSYYFNTHIRIQRKRFDVLDELYKYLYSGGYIEEMQILDFEEAFSGKVVEANFTPIKWLKQENLCVYLFDLLVEFEIISEMNIPKKIGLIFGIANASQKRDRYLNNKEGKPKGYKPIEAIVNNIQKGLD
ncbi:hypothetical protein OAC16_02395 [Flavobacteriaceae bacterium]|nr:hypothetical protein [Flavobacteriaceae bacterium]